jgi:glutamate-ammonia-ligase adenylyltransferase
LNKYSEYLQNRARVWEFQAFLKSNFICGNRNYFNRLIREFIERLKYFETIDLKTEMLEMRNKIVSSNNIPGSISIKKNPGGLVDLEFILSYFLLSNYQLVEKIIGGGTELWMNILSLKKGIKINFKIIKNNFSTLKRIELANQNLFDVRTARIPVENAKLDQLCIFLGYKNSNVFNKQLNENIQSTQFLFNQVLGNK